MTASLVIVAMAVGFTIGTFSTYHLLKNRNSNAEPENNLQVIDSVFNNATNLLISRLENHINTLEYNRNAAMSDLYNQLRSVEFSQKELRDETLKLRAALSSNTFRGQWGEIQLKRVVEIAGMVERCDFDLQVTTTSSDANFRPDMVVHLPNDSTIVVDAKCPLNSFLLALDEPDPEVKDAHLKQHAKELEKHITGLSSKSYWAQFPNSPEFVIMFLPSEAIFSYALTAQPDLIEKGTQNKVIIATPTTLIALLKAVSYGWRQDELSKNAQAVSVLATELHTRLIKFNEHFLKVGKSLNQSVDTFNNAVSSFDSRVMSTIRKFENLTGADGNLENPEQITNKAKGGMLSSNDNN